MTKERRQEVRTKAIMLAISFPAAVGCMMLHVVAYVLNGRGQRRLPGQV